MTFQKFDQARLKKEIAENKARKLQRRTIARMLLLLLMRANDHKVCMCVHVRLCVCEKEREIVGVRVCTKQRV